MKFIIGDIKDVVIKKYLKRTDERGWLVELFRKDELDKEVWPVMSYISQTEVGIARGPHEHEDQTDIFAFIGPSTFKVYLWDYRPESETYGKRMMVSLGEDEPGMVIIPPGIVHAYKNIGTVPGWVVNLPNRLYAGEGRKEEVDEIRHEDNPDSMFLLD
jgi:dTDP-4-dehydrorhamnose 3,5-epimerase